VLDVEYGAACATPYFLLRVGASREQAAAHGAGVGQDSCRAYLVGFGGRTFLHYQFRERGG